MTRIELYKRQLDQHRSDFIATFAEVLRSPVPATADFGSLYYQNDGSGLIPVSLSWMTRDNSHISPDICPFAKFARTEWIWTNEDLDNCVHEDADEYFFDWVSRCWIDAGGGSFSPLFVIYDHGSMDILELGTLKTLSDEDIEKRLNNPNKPNKGAIN